MGKARDLSTLLNASGQVPLPSKVAGVLPDANAPSGSVIQVVSAIKTDTFTASTGASTWVDIPGLSVAITPSSASSRILILAHTVTGEDVSDFTLLRLVRNSTAIGVGDANSARLRASSGAWANGANNAFQNIMIHHMDEPASASSVTYKLQLTTGVQTGYINRNRRYIDAYYDATLISAITVMEVAA